MAIEIKAPAFPESVADGEIATWHKGEGDAVSRDELIVEIETDKVVMEVLAPEDGVITKIHAKRNSSTNRAGRSSVDRGTYARPRQHRRYRQGRTHYQGGRAQPHEDRRCRASSEPCSCRSAARSARGPFQ